MTAIQVQVLAHESLTQLYQCGGSWLGFGSQFLTPIEGFKNQPSGSEAQTMRDRVGPQRNIYFNGAWKDRE